MKFLHIPKKKNIIFFGIALVLSFILNLIFLLMSNSIVEYNLDILLLAHIFLPVLYGIISCMIFSYFIMTVEKCLQNFKSVLQLKIFTILQVVEIFMGILIILYDVYFTKTIQNVFNKMLIQSFYFKSLVANEDISNVLLYWISIQLFIMIAIAAIMFIAAKRQSKIKKQIRENEKERQSTNELTKYLGFIYEESEFYRQIQIPYLSLRQMDGTRGEFEVYHMLRKHDLTNVKYIFNREIPKSDGLNTELDQIIIHKNGIFVVENKHYTTRIYGNALDYDLTIIDHSGNKKSIYNPIKQNENHVVALKEFLKLKDLYINDEITPVYSIVVFTAEGNDKTDNIISGISTVGTETKVCTSQNVYHIINQIISSSDSIADINVSKINEVLLKLPVRKKFS